MFITFEGIDGCGKTTQLELLHARLLQQEYSVCRTREPGGTVLAELIRSYLLHSDNSLEKRTELLLFGAARAQHVAEVIVPALARREIVLSDRFADSSLAYQGGGLGLDFDFIQAMNTFATGNRKPNITLFLDLDPVLAFQRRCGEKADRIEARGLEFQARVREAYLEIARCEPERIVLLDAADGPSELHAQVVAALRSRGMELAAA